MEKKTGNDYLGCEIGSILYLGRLDLQICALKLIMGFTKFQLQEGSQWLFSPKEDKL